MKTTSKISLPSIFFAPSPPFKRLPEIFLMTFQLDSHNTTDVRPEMIPGIKTGNGIPHDKYNIRGIAHVRTNRKDDIFWQRQLYIDKSYMVLDIFRSRWQNIDMNRAEILA